MFLHDYDTDDILATLAELFAAEGKAREVAVLACSIGEFLFVEHSNWNGGIDIYDFSVKVERRIFAGLEGIDDCANEIKEKLTRIFSDLQNDAIGQVHIVPRIERTEDWREKANAWLSGADVNNQGKVRSYNIAARSCDGLLFRSQAEINLYRALKSMGVPFAPLAVFVKGGSTYKRIEPDFIIIKDGIVLMVEVDGDTVHHETPAEAHDRATMLHREGVHIERLKASDCSTAEKSAECARNLIGVIDKIRTRR